MRNENKMANLRFCSSNDEIYGACLNRYFLFKLFKVTWSKKDNKEKFGNYCLKKNGVLSRTSTTKYYKIMYFPVLYLRGLLSLFFQNNIYEEFIFYLKFSWKLMFESSVFLTIVSIHHRGYWYYTKLICESTYLIWNSL